MIGIVPCNKPAHGVRNHVAGTRAARECGATRGRVTAGLTLARLPIIASTSTSTGDLQELLDSQHEYEYEAVVAANPSYSESEILDEVTLRLIDRIPDINSAWQNLPSWARRQIGSSGDMRAQRADLSVYIGQHIERAAA